MGGEYASCRICRLAKKYRAGVMVDDATAWALIGKEGAARRAITA